MKDTEDLMVEQQELERQLRKEKEDHKVTNDNYNDMIKNWESELQQRRIIESELKDRLADLKDSMHEIQQLQQENARFREESDKVKQTIAQLSPEYSEKEVIEKQYQIIESELKDRMDEIQRLQQEKIALRKELESELKDRMDEIERLQQENIALREELDHTAPSGIGKSAADLSTQSSKRKAASKTTLPMIKYLKEREIVRQNRQKILKLREDMQEQSCQFDKACHDWKNQKIILRGHINKYKERIFELESELEKFNRFALDTRERADSVLSSPTLPPLEHQLGVLTQRVQIKSYPSSRSRSQYSPEYRGNQPKNYHTLQFSTPPKRFR